MPLNNVLSKCTEGFKFTKLQEKIYQLTYIDDIKILTKNEKELETLIQTLRIYNDDIGMKFGIEEICHHHNEKWKKRESRMNRTTKS